MAMGTKMAERSEKTFQSDKYMQSYLVRLFGIIITRLKQMLSLPVYREETFDVTEKVIHDLVVKHCIKIAVTLKM